jgi:four helix bundle protein
MPESEKSKKIFELGERTFLFAKAVRDFCLQLPKNVVNQQYVPQLLRASSSPGANYIEANEHLGDKDFGMKIKICRREAKESKYWLQLILLDGSEKQEEECRYLIQEATELVLIFTAIINKRQSSGT